MNVEEGEIRWNVYFYTLRFTHCHGFTNASRCDFTTALDVFFSSRKNVPFAQIPSFLPFARTRVLMRSRIFRFDRIRGLSFVIRRSLTRARRPLSRAPAARTCAAIHAAAGQSPVQLLRESLLLLSLSLFSHTNICVGADRPHEFPATLSDSQLLG